MKLFHNLIILVVIFGIGVMLFFALRNGSNLGRSGAASDVKLYFVPASETMPPSKSVKLILDAGTKQVTFARVDIAIDKSKVKLGGDITTSSKFKTVITKSTPTDVNNTGMISLVLAVSPADRSTLPTGLIELATIPLSVVTTTANISTSLSIVPASTQIVGTPSTQLTADYAPLALTLNPVTQASPTPVVSATTVTLTPTADTSTVSTDPSSLAYGTRTTLLVNGGPINTAYMKYDLSSLAGKNIASAKLRIRVDAASGSASVDTQNVKEVTTTTWAENTLTYSNRPALGSVIATNNGGSSGQWKDIDVTNYVKAKAGSVVALALDQTGGDGFIFYSRESADTPQLVVNFASAPTPTSGSVYSVRLVNRPYDSTRSLMDFDAIIENGSKTEETSSRFTYTTKWTPITTAGASGGTMKSATGQLQSVSFTTTASSITVITFTGPNRGSFDVYVNGVLKKNVVTNATQDQSQYPVVINFQ